ncbi:DUF3256 family protein [Phocaeicola sp.]
MKKIIAIFIGMMGAVFVQAQDMKSLFVSMPDSVAPLLTKVNREDCIDFLASNMKAEVKNRFGNPSELKKLTGDYLFMQTTPQSSVEMKLLPVNDSVKVVCVVNTVCASACDSQLRFYSTDWNELPVEDFVQLPLADAFYASADSSEAYADIRAKADMELIKIELSPENTTLSFTYTTPDYLAKEDREKISAYLRKSPVVYKWGGGKFTE